MAEAMQEKPAPSRTVFVSSALPGDVALVSGALPRDIVSVSGALPRDIIELIMADHRRIRRLCDVLDDTARRSTDPEWTLAQAWLRLAGLLEAHTRAEEEICYLLTFGCDPQGAECRREAIADHDDIREAIGEAFLRNPGSTLWWHAVRTVLATAVAHLDREERGPLADAVNALTMSRRRELGQQWSAFIMAWTLDGVSQAHW